MSKESNDIENTGKPSQDTVTSVLMQAAKQLRKLGVDDLDIGDAFLKMSFHQYEIQNTRPYDVAIKEAEFLFLDTKALSKSRLRELTIEDFKMEWEVSSRATLCAEVGSPEYQQVAQDWLDSGKPWNVSQFIIEYIVSTEMGSD